MTSRISCAPSRSRRPAALRQRDTRAVIAWERFMRESEHAAPPTVVAAV
jgi:hypothetical protein